MYGVFVFNVILWFDGRGNKVGCMFVGKVMILLCWRICCFVD